MLLALLLNICFRHYVNVFHSMMTNAYILHHNYIYMYITTILPIRPHKTPYVLFDNSKILT